MRSIILVILAFIGLSASALPANGILEVSSKNRNKVIRVEEGTVIKVRTEEGVIKGAFMHLNDSMFTVNGIPFHINEIESIYLKRFRPFGTGLLIAGTGFVAIGASLAALPDTEIEGCNQVVGLFVGCIGLVGVIPGIIITASKKRHSNKNWSFSLTKE